MDEKTNGTYVIYQHPTESNDALYVDGELIKFGKRDIVMQHALELLDVEFRTANDHIHSGSFIRDLSDIRLNKKTALRKRAKELEKEGGEVVAALHEIDDMYWGPFDEHD